MTNTEVQKLEPYQVFFGSKYVVVQAISDREVFFKAKMTQLMGPFRTEEEHMLAARETKMSGKVYCPNGGRAIFDEEHFYTPGQMWTELFMHDMFAGVRSLADDLKSCVDNALLQSGKGDLSI